MKTTAATAQARQSMQELGKLGQDRQKLSDDLRTSESRCRAPNATSLRTNGRLRPSCAMRLAGWNRATCPTWCSEAADWLNRGVDPNANSTESQIGKGLQQLSSQMREAQQAVGSGQPQDSETALDRVQRLRDQLQASIDATIAMVRMPARMDGKVNPVSPAKTVKVKVARVKMVKGQNGQSGQNGRNGGNRVASTAQILVAASMAAQYGDTRNGGGYRNGTQLRKRRHWQPNLHAGTAAAPVATPSGDTEAAIQQGVNELNQLRQTVQDDPETLRQVQDLIREMQNLDPARFPGNPAMVEQLHAQVLSDVDKLELRLQRSANEKQSGQVRSSDTDTVPAGYQDAVAEYFRRLSKRP